MVEKKKIVSRGVEHLELYCTYNSTPYVPRQSSIQSLRGKTHVCSWGDTKHVYIEYNLLNSTLLFLDKVRHLPACLPACRWDIPTAFCMDWNRAVHSGRLYIPIIFDYRAGVLVSVLNSPRHTIGQWRNCLCKRLSYRPKAKGWMALGRQPAISWGKKKTKQ